MPNFKVGDRVRTTDGNLRELVGRIVGFPMGYECLVVSVEFPKFVGGHNCRGLAKDGYGWNLSYKELELVSTCGSQEEEE